MTILHAMYLNNFIKTKATSTVLDPLLTQVDALTTLICGIVAYATVPISYATQHLHTTVIIHHIVITYLRSYR